MKMYGSTRMKESVPPNKYPTYGEYIVASLLKIADMVKSEDPYAASKLVDFSKRYRKLINEYGEKIRLDGGHETDTSLYTLIVSHGLEGFRKTMEDY